MPSVNVGDIDLSYEINGEGHPLLLISGLGYCAWYWHKIVPDLSNSYQVITFDNRGAGSSDKPGGTYSVRMMAEDATGLLDALGIQNAYVMGHSLGGFIAQEMINLRPDLISKLILASTNHGGMNVIPITPEAMDVMTNRDGDPIEIVKRGISISCAPGFIDRNEDLVQELIQYRFTNPVPPDQYQAQVMAGVGMAGLTDDQVADRMAGIKIPTLILFGEYDMVVPPGNADLLADKIPDAEVEIINGAGHMFPIEDPEATISAIRSFLR